MRRVLVSGYEQLIPLLLVWGMTTALSVDSLIDALMDQGSVAVCQQTSPVWSGTSGGTYTEVQSILSKTPVPPRHRPAHHCRTMHEAMHKKAAATRAVHSGTQAGSFLQPGTRRKAERERADYNPKPIAPTNYMHALCTCAHIY